MSSADFAYTRVRIPGPGWQRDWADLLGTLDERLGGSGAGVWGAFAGRFGVPSNELIVISSGDEQATPLAVADLDGIDVIEHRPMRPTARPEDSGPLTRGGLHVLRWFHLEPSHVDEFIELSTGAWTSFETDDDFASRPVGLFAVPGVAALVDRMLLVTWYDGFESWQRSRNPDPEAKTAFVRRHSLTTSTLALATELVVS